MPGPRPRALIDIQDHVIWGREVALSVSASFNFLRDSQEEADIISVAYLTLCEKALKFDPQRVGPLGPGAMFRRWAGRTLRTMCVREAIRLRNGGTYHTRREKEHDAPLVVGSLPAPRCANCSEVMGDAAPLSNCETTLSAEDDVRRRRRPESG